MRMQAMIIAGALLTVTAVAHAQNCCLPKLADDDASARLFGGIQAATILLMALPPLLIGGVSFWMYRGRQAEPENEERESAAVGCAPSSDGEPR